MPTLVACTKCQTRYQIPETALGKTIECKKCGVKFVAAVAPSPEKVTTATSKTTQPGGRVRTVSDRRYSDGAPAEELARLGLGEPIRRQADPLAEELVPPAKDILGNFAAEPGFVSIQNATSVKKGNSSVTATVDALVENPYAKELEASRKRRAQFQGEPGYEFRSLVTIEKIFSISAWIVLVGFALLALTFALPFVIVLDPEIKPFSESKWSTTLFSMMIIGIVQVIVASVVWAIMLLIFMYRANSNLRALGTKDLRFTPGMTIAAWFIPIVAAFWPCQAMGEIYKASQFPFGSKWKREPFPGIVVGWWVFNLIGLFFVSLPMLMKITKTISKKQERFAN